MEANRLKPIDDVRIEMYADGVLKDAHQGSGYHTVQQAIEAAYNGIRANSLNIEDYVYVVKNLTTGTQARYRVNAGDHARLIPEEETDCPRNKIPACGPGE